MRLGLAIEPGRVSAVVLGRHAPVWAADAAWSDEIDLAALIADLAAERPARAMRATVLLGEPVARLKEVSGLPPMKRHDLRAHVRLHSRRYFLQNGIPLVTDAAPLPDRGKGAVLAAALAPTIDAICRGLDAAGLACDGIHPAPEGIESDADRFALASAAARGLSHHLTLLPESTRIQQGVLRRHSLIRWAMIAAAGCLLALLSIVGAAVRREARTQRLLAELAPAAALAREVRRNLDSTTVALNVVAQAHRASRSILLANLAQALPDSAFLTSLSLDQERGTLSGYAVSAPAVLAQLERRRAVSAARFEGPLTREVVRGRELQRFTIAFRPVP